MTSSENINEDNIEDILEDNLIEKSEVEVKPCQRHDHLFKVVVLGDAKVGKTSLLASFTGSKFTEEYLPTLAVDFKTKVLTYNDKNIKLQIW